EDLPRVDAIVVPYGGGGLSSGVAAAVKALQPEVKIFAAEVETAAPLAASFAAGRPTSVAYVSSFVDGIGGRALFDAMWPLVRGAVDGSLTVPVADAARAVRLLVERNRLVAEGAGATSVAAAVAGLAGEGRVVAIVSGGNIDATKLAAVMSGSVTGA